MNETCDRCGPAVVAVYRVDGDGELYLCTPCSSRLWTSLNERGWDISPISVLLQAPQAW